MTESEREHLAAECLEDYHRRRALGESPIAEDYRERLGPYYDDFVEVLTAESALDEVLDPQTSLPQPFGAYTLLRELGRGAMGVVYEAIHRDLGRKVALKVLRTGFDTQPAAFERFRREAQACAQVRHENIVEIYESGQVDGRPFYAMPLIEGRTLSELVRSGDVPEVPETCTGLASIADALEAMHGAGIVHRDVKPANILIEPDGKWILCDFGLARTAEAEGLTQTGEALGTPLYMSPEQLLGKREAIDGRTDVYGLGVTMYAALSGRPPFKTPDIGALMRMILADRPEPLGRVAPHVPKDCAYIAMKALEKRRRDRYASAAEMSDDLRAFVAGRAVSGRPISGLRHRLRRMRRYSVAAVVVVASGVAGMIWYSNRPATLTLHSYPIARVEIDGEDKGMTPVRVSLAPGSHTVTLHLEGFGPRRRTISLDAGEKRVLDTALIASDPDDPETLRLLGLELDRMLEAFSDPEVVRSAPGGAPVEVLYPRGDVRLEDLTTYRLDVTDHLFEPDGTLEFRRGKEVIYRTAFDPQRVVTQEPIPDEVRRALDVGDAVTWGYFPREGSSAATGGFQVVADVVLRDLDERLAGQPERVKSWFHMQRYLENGLDLAAFREARRVLLEEPESVVAWKVVDAALVRMGLRETSVWTEVQQQLDRLAKED